MGGGRVVFNYDPPGFCDGCGSAYPWATRQQRLWQVGNLLGIDREVEEADELKARGVLEELEPFDLCADEEEPSPVARLAADA